MRIPTLASVWRSGLFALAVLAAPVLLSSGAEAGNPCQDPWGNNVPGCVQANSPYITLGHTGTSSGAAIFNVYCPPNAPYWWGGANVSYSHSWHETNYPSVPQPAFYATIEAENLSPWYDNTVNATIGCSPFNPTPVCTSGPTTRWSDPGCASSNWNNEQDSEGQTTWQTWTEECIGSDNQVTLWSCTNVALAIFCTTCGTGSGDARKSSVGTAKQKISVRKAPLPVPALPE